MKKTKQLHINTDESTKRLIEQASALRGISLSAFMIYNSVEQSRKILKEEVSQSS
jgi:uncharacterized protein (DUF1778 family)